MFLFVLKKGISAYTVVFIIKIMLLVKYPHKQVFSSLIFSVTKKKTGKPETNVARF